MEYYVTTKNGGCRKMFYGIPVLIIQRIRKHDAWEDDLTKGLEGRAPSYLAALPTGLNAAPLRIFQCRSPWWKSACDCSLVPLFFGDMATCNFSALSWDVGRQEGRKQPLRS